MAAGKPVIVSSEGGLPEIVQDGENGYICEAFNPNSLSECLRKMEQLDDEQYMKLVSCAKYKATQMFNAEKYLDCLIYEYQSLLASKRG